MQGCGAPERYFLVRETEPERSLYLATFARSFDLLEVRSKQSVM